METRTGILVPTCFCPICGTHLDRSDLDKAPEDYFCPFCSSQETPARATRRAGWGYPD